jgi:hypothetical protein
MAIITPSPRTPHTPTGDIMAISPQTFSDRKIHLLLPKRKKKGICAEFS